MNSTFATHIVSQTLAQYDRISDDFDSTRNQSTDFTSLTQYVKPGALVLDAGCGNGRLIEVLRGVGANLICVDGSGELIHIARERYAEDVKNGWLGFVHRDLTSLPFDSHQFDVVFLLAVLHHIPSEHMHILIMKELHTMTKIDRCCIGTV